jgi:hypothetical protein
MNSYRIRQDQAVNLSAFAARAASSMARRIHESRIGPMVTPWL